MVRSLPMSLQQRQKTRQRKPSRSYRLRCLLLSTAMRFDAGMAKQTEERRPALSYLFDWGYTF
jgi:hypothetical protein